MNSIENASFVSPLAGPDLNLQPQQSFGFLEKTWNQLNAWTIFFTLLALCAAYDQCKHQPNPFTLVLVVLTLRRQLPVPEIWHHRPGLENALYRALSRVNATQFSQIQGEVGKWRPELCLGLSQVRCSHSSAPILLTRVQVRGHCIRP